jgi:PAS domain S-box-containing protein
MVVTIVTVVGIEDDMKSSFRRLNKGLDALFAFIEYEQKEMPTMAEGRFPEFNEIVEKINNHAQVVQEAYELDEEFIEETLQIVQMMREGEFDEKLYYDANNPALNRLKDVFNSMLLIIRQKIETQTEELERINGSLSDQVFHQTVELNNQVQDLSQFKLALDESAIVSKTDIDGVITYVNQKFCDVTGFERHELMGQTHRLIRDKSNDDAVYKKLWETILSKNIYHDTMTNINKNGSRFYADTTIVPLLDTHGDITEYLVIRYDVTKLAIALEKAVAAEKAKGEFLSNMSHEIRTPLNAIIGFVTLLKSKITDESSAKYLNIVHSSSNALLDIINDILDFSKIQSGTFEINKKNFDPSHDLDHVISLFSSKAMEKQLKYSYDLADQLPDCVIADNVRIKQVFSNLVSNAIKFTPEEGSVKIVIDYQEGDLIIEVKDSGIGIALENQEKIFQAFAQVDGTTTREYGGTGLGLSISSKLVQLMGGILLLESEEGKGSTFKVQIPCEKCMKKVTNELTISDHEKQFKGKVLIAEDNKTNQMLIKILISKFGLEHQIVADGNEAVEAFKAEKFSLVLMDENMPNLNGLGALKQIRAYEKEQGLNPTPIVALTANVMVGDRERFLEAGMNDFVGKPINVEELKQVFEKLL